MKRLQATTAADSQEAAFGRAWTAPVVLGALVIASMLGVAGCGGSGGDTESEATDAVTLHGAPEAFEAAANRAAAVADALGRAHDAEDRERAGLGALIVAAGHGPEAAKLLRLARVALAAVAGDAFGAGFRECELPRALVVAVGERGEARGEPGSDVAEELTALLAFVLHVLRRAAASQPDPLRYVASGPPAATSEWLPIVATPVVCEL